MNNFVTWRWLAMFALSSVGLFITRSICVGTGSKQTIQIKQVVL
jgi:hypothetical protein